jgi:hypothetical protein
MPWVESKAGTKQSRRRCRQLHWNESMSQWTQRDLVYAMEGATDMKNLACFELGNEPSVSIISWSAERLAGSQEWPYNMKLTYTETFRHWRITF